MNYDLYKQMISAAERKDFSRAKMINRELIQLQSIDKEGKALFFPNYIQLEHTNKCNAECIMCSHFYSENKGSFDIDSAIVEKLKPILPYCATIMLNGDGEPFLLKNITGFLNIYSEYEIKIGTNTNLSFLSDELLEIISKHFTFLNISCDSCITATYEYIRRGLKFDIFRENLGKLNEFTPNVKKILDCVIMRQNINEAEEILLFAKDNNFAQVRFNMLRTNSYLDNQNDSLRAFRNYSARKLQQAKKFAEKIDIDVIFPIEFCFDYNSSLADMEAIQTDFSLDSGIPDKQTTLKEQNKCSQLCDDYRRNQLTYEELEINPFISDRHCQWAFERCYIDLTGKVTTCCYDLFCSFGSLSDERSTFQNIWNGALYKQFRKNMLMGQLPAWCSSCDFMLNGGKL